MKGRGAWDTSPRTGASALRHTLAEHVGANPEELAVTSGIRGQVAALLADTGTLVVERPTFLSVPRLAEQYGKRVVSRDWEDILAGRGFPPDSVLWITSPARNPDGRTLTRAEADRLDALAADGARVVVNQAYHWCAPDAPRPRRAVLLGSLHKLAGGGVSLGWRVTPGGAGPDRPAAGGPPTGWQLAWADFIGRGGLELLLPGALYGPAARCRRFAQALNPPAGVRLCHGDGPSLSLVLPDGVTEQTACEELAVQGLAVGAGSAFGWHKNAVRLSFTGAADDDLTGCVEGVHRALARLLPA
ncbi:hypothetical protein GCM10010221_55220 [Streptomyces parvus]|nr:hypothetical protein GCM10010221_55220 [Streptomyces parvus]